MKITALTENTSQNANLKCEHGLSLYIETNYIKVLFDMGQTNIFAENASMLNIDLNAVDVAVLSHGHYDHGGGLETFLSLNKKAPIYINKNAFNDFYNADFKYIGLDKKLQYNNRFIFTDNEAIINDNIKLYSCNEKKRLFNLGSFGLKECIDGQYIDDPFLHEQYMLIEENEKRILISGCSHKGIIDIVNWFKPDILIGGFHFSKLKLEQTLYDAAKKLSSYNTTYYTCHCTGTLQYEYMKNIMPNLKYISCGETITI